MEIEQTNLRIPTEAKETMKLAARLLREDRNFGARLKRFLDEEATGDVSGLLSQRVERLENQMAEMLAGQGTARPAAGPPRAKERTEKPAGRVDAEDLQHARWTQGEGRGRRLTPEGEVECLRLIDEGMSDADIAARLGVKSYSVFRRRENLAATRA